MSTENHEQRIADLEKTVAILRIKLEIVKKIPDLLQLETAGRIDMWVKLWQALVMLIKSHNNLACLVADSSLVSNAEERQEILKQAAELESGCALIEKVFQPLGGSPGSDPAAPTAPPNPPT